MTNRPHHRLLFHLPKTESYTEIHNANFTISCLLISEGIYACATSFMEKLILPILSLPRHTTVTLSPSVSTSST